MRICDMNTGVMQLTKAAKRLREQWDESHPKWTDQNARDFEQKFLNGLSPQLTTTLAVVNRMADLLAQAERDCLDDEQP